MTNDYLQNLQHASGATQVIAGGVVGSTFAAGATSGVLAVAGAPTTAIAVASGIASFTGSVASVSPAIASGLILTAKAGVVAGVVGTCFAPFAVVGLIGFGIFKAISD